MPCMLQCSLPPGKIHLRNTRDQLQLVGPKSLGVALLTAGFVGMVFTIQVIRLEAVRRKSNLALK